jgi:putative glutamine amidotransferase
MFRRTCFESAVRPHKPVIGVLCCNEHHDRPIQSVASRFIEPLARYANATALLVPALTDSLDAASLVERLDGLLLTGSRSNVSAKHYAGACDGQNRIDEQRDDVALTLAASMIEAGRPVFGICRGLQEINVLFGGSLTTLHEADRHHRSQDDGVQFEQLFDHWHDVNLVPDGMLHNALGLDCMTVNSVHQQGIDRLGAGLRIEAVSTQDNLIEAISARPFGSDVLAVQWHPEWNASESREGRAFFELIRRALYRGREVEASQAQSPSHILTSRPAGPHRIANAR